MSKAFFLLCWCFATSAFADILFVDMNSSASEVAAARREAERRGEAFVVVPTGAPTKPIDQIIQDALKQQVAKKRSFSSLIVSGHYTRAGNQGKFYGTANGTDVQITYARLSQILMDPAVASIRRNVKSLLLWGCYTARPRAIADWKGLLPGTKLVAGFNFAAPPSTALSSPVLMRNVLRLQSHLNDRNLINNVVGLLNLTQGKETPYNFFGNTNLTLVVQGCYLTSNMGRIDEEDLTECPPSLLNRLVRRRVRSFDPYANATSPTAELLQRARSHGETGLYRFRMDAIQYVNCFKLRDDLPSPEQINELCARFDCN